MEMNGVYSWVCFYSTRSTREPSWETHHFYTYMLVVLLYALCSCVDGDGVRWKSAVVSPPYKYEPGVHKKNIMDAEASSYDESMSEPVENSNTETADEETTQTSSGEARDDLFERIETWRIITFSLLGDHNVLSPRCRARPHRRNSLCCDEQESSELWVRRVRGSLVNVFLFMNRFFSSLRLITYLFAADFG